MRKDRLKRSREHFTQFMNFLLSEEFYRQRIANDKYYTHVPTLTASLFTQKTLELLTQLPSSRHPSLISLQMFSFETERMCFMFISFNEWNILSVDENFNIRIEEKVQVIWGFNQKTWRRRYRTVSYPIIQKYDEIGNLSR